MVAAAASWMESFKLPLRQVERTYRKSELALMGWRNSEIAANMAAQRNKTPQFNDQPAIHVPDEAMDVLEERLGAVAAKLDEDLDLRKLTGPEVMKYMGALGILVVPNAMGKPKYSDSVTDAYKKAGR